MARTALAATSIIIPKGPNQGTLSAGDLQVVPAAADVANGNYYTPTPGDFLIAWNSGASPYTITLASTVDERKRLNDITAYNLVAGDFICFHYGDLVGWKQADGTIYLNASNAAVKFFILRDPG